MDTNKIYDILTQNNLFDKNYTYSVKFLLAKYGKNNVVKEKITNILAALVKEGRIAVENDILVNKAKHLANPDKQGTFKKRGNGGVVVFNNNGKKEFLNVPVKTANEISHNSKVRFTVEKTPSGQKIAIINQVIVTENNKLYGNVVLQEGVPVFVPDNQEFGQFLNLVINEYALEAVGKRVYLIVDDNELSKAQDLYVGIIESPAQILGSAEQILVYANEFIKTKNVEFEFPQSVLEQVQTLKEGFTEEDLKEKVDMRGKHFITIDPENAHEIDDAVCIEEVKVNGNTEYYDVFIGIADVPHYVKENTPLYNEGLKRGTTIYYAAQAIPMYPARLATDLASLNHGQERAALVTCVRLEKSGKVVSYDFKRAIIKNHYQFTYEEISALHNNDKEMIEKFGTSYKNYADLLYKVSNLLTAQAKAKGRLKIKGSEATIIMSKDKSTILDYRNDNSVDSHAVIENFMVLANNTYSRFLTSLQVPHISRIHKMPTLLSFQKLKEELASTFDIQTNNSLSSGAYQEILRQIVGHPQEKLINLLVVLSMQKAVYAVDEKTGHFGLGLVEKPYSHFTSPLRRGSDLISQHLLIKTLQVFKQIAQRNNIEIKDVPVSELITKIHRLSHGAFYNIVKKDRLEQLAEHFNKTEARAVEIDSYADKLAQIAYMKQFVGTIQTGYISAIKENEIIVTLKNELDPLHSEIIEVKVPVDEFKKLVEIGTRKTLKTTAKLGDEVAVKIVEANLQQKTITATTNFEKVNEKIVENSSENTNKKDNQTETVFEWY